MIIIGYPGIGKSHNAGVHPILIENEGSWLGYIDLESHNFWNEYENVDGFGHRGRDRDPKWFETYCKMAVDLSNQGYIVFVSSHAAVQKELRKYQNDIIVCYPSASLKREWLLRLRFRYICSNNWENDKSLKAYEHAVEQFDTDINALKNSGFPAIEITNMDYKLRNLIEEFIAKKEHWYD